MWTQIRKLIYYVPGLTQLIVLFRRHVMKKKKFQRYSLEVVLYKMCLAVGADYDGMNFKSDNWFWEYEWSIKKEAEFRNWLVCYARSKRVMWGLSNSLSTYKEFRIKVAKEFLLNYGWRNKK